MLVVPSSALAQLHLLIGFTFMSPNIHFIKVQSWLQIVAGRTKRPNRGSTSDPASQLSTEEEITGGGNPYGSIPIVVSGAGQNWELV